MEIRRPLPPARRRAERGAGPGALGGKQAGKGRGERCKGKAPAHGWRARLTELELGLENRLHDKVGLLSGGQRQALSLLMACLVPNRALLLDEHTAALDPGAADTVLRLTDQFAERDRLTVLMVTHSMAQALRHGTRTIMLHEGQIVVDLSAAERAELGVPGLLDLFQQVRGQPVDDDAMVLS